MTITLDRRRFVGAAAGLGLASMTGATAAASSSWADAPLERLVGRMLILGFLGDAPGGGDTDALTDHLAEGRVGGALFLRHNARSRAGIEGLTAQFRAAAPDAFLSVDQEGGFVQRLSGDMGYYKIPTASALVEAGPEAARAAFDRGAEELAAAGFNMNLAPIADLHQDGNAVIARWERAFGDDPAAVAQYCALFVEAMEARRIACSIKHFPGHGRSIGDSHDGYVDLTETWSFEEVEPFARLIDTDHAHLIMGGHLVNERLDPEGLPATLSRPMLRGLLRQAMGYSGAIITDDLDMGAIRSHYSREEAIVRSIAAGNDLLLISNSADADPDLPRRAVDWVGAAVERGDLTMDRLVEASIRIDALHQITDPV
ncbi:MAG: glycoside hydrolase family 3 N-terminal domain-containing protein [Oceanicaulis sp.]